ncbi:transcription antitermination protein NusB [Candidatus Gracilibacteria bacterium]|nr:transcription antitermination protein NusB [Candidatus Gracilibacteria bacterium]
MQVSRKKTRKFLLQKLYARIYGDILEQRFHESFFEGILTFDIDEKYLSEMFQIILDNQDTILSIIAQYAPKFDIDSMLKTNILSMCIAIAEMLYIKEEIPGKVSINEAIDLAKYYGDDTSKNIVNGILNGFYKNIETHQDELNKISKKYEFFA